MFIIEFTKKHANIIQSLRYATNDVNETAVAIYVYTIRFSPAHMNTILFSIKRAVE